MTLEQLHDLIRAVLLAQGILGVLLLVGLIYWRKDFPK